MNYRKVFGVALLITLTFIVRPSFASTFVFFGGVADGFALPSDSSSPSSEMLSVGPAQQDFDLIANVNGGDDNTDVVHTFSALPAGITSASLRMRVQAGSSGGSEDNDGVVLAFVDSSTADWKDAIVYLRTFGLWEPDRPSLLPEDPGLLQSTIWSPGNDFTFTLDLSALPLVDGGNLNLLAELNTNGFLDVVVGDETGVDYMELTVEAVPLPAVPLPAAVWLFGTALIGLVGFSKRRKAA